MTCEQLSNCDAPIGDQVRCILNGAVKVRRGFDYNDFTEIADIGKVIVDATFAMDPTGVLTLGAPIVNTVPNVVGVEITAPAPGNGFTRTKITCFAELDDGSILPLCGIVEADDC